MPVSIPSNTLEKFTTFGDLLRFLRRRVSLTQMELAAAVGYSDSQISRLEQNLRLPDLPTIQSQFVPALGLEEEPKAVARLLDLAANVRREDSPALGLCPYKGLNYFEEADADLFFGREALTAKLTERILALTRSGRADPARFVAIVGASGSGKSSLARAGLVASLRWNNRSADWRIHVLTPTAHPLERLTEMLSADTDLAPDIEAWKHNPRAFANFVARAFQSKKPTPFLLVIDQFEETFTLCRSEEERAAFIGSLLGAASEAEGMVSVIVTLRADFYAHCADYPALRGALAQNQEYIGAMSAGELRRAIEEPARRGRWEIEPGLVDLLLHDVGQEPGALPLLSHALFETWQRRRARTMTLSGYASSGGVRGAIAETAETVFTDQFTREQQAIARRIFLRLTELSDEISLADTRRRATINELILKPEDRAATHTVLKSLADARLITTSEDSAEVAHEALIREWPTLRGWLEDNRDGLRLHRHLTDAAQEWQATNREPDLLFRGARLSQLREWTQSQPDELNALEREFLKASIDAADREAREREDQRQRELDNAQKLAETEQRRADEQVLAARRLQTRNRFITAIGSIAIVLAVVALVFGQKSNTNAMLAEYNAQAAVTAQAAAETNAALAEKQARLARARELATSANNSLADDPQRSILLALESLHITRVDRLSLPESVNALHHAIAASRIQLTFTAHEGTIWAMDFSPDGTRLATGGADKTLRIWDANTFENLLTIDAHDLDVDSLSFSPDGKRIATSSDDGTAKIWDAATGKPLLTLTGHTDWVMAVAFRPDGAQIATLSADKSIRFWDAINGKQLSEWNDLQDPGYQLAFSPDGARLIYIDAGQLFSRDAQTGESTIIHSDSGISLFAQSADGRRLAVIDDFIRVLDSASGQTLYNITPPGNRVEHIAFSPDGAQLAIAGRDRKITVLDSASGATLSQLAGHDQFIFRFAFSPDGKKIVSADQNGAIKVWTLEPTHEILTLPIGGLGSLALSPDGTRGAAILDDSLRLFNLRDGSLLFEQAIPDTSFTAVAYSPDGTEIATGGTDQVFRLWDTNGKLTRELAVTNPKILAIAYRPDGHEIAFAGLDGIISMYDRASNNVRITWDAQAGQISSLSFSPEGSRLIVGTLDINNAKIFDVTTDKEIMSLVGHTNNPVSVSFNLDGTRIATSGRDSTARIWDSLTGNLLLTLSGHTSTVTSIRFSQNGKLIATASRDGTVRVWDTTTGEELLNLGMDGASAAAIFTPDGNHLITWDFTGIKVFTLNVEELMQIAKSRLTRTWTSEECKKFLHANICPAIP